MQTRLGAANERTRVARLVDTESAQGRLLTGLYGVKAGRKPDDERQGEDREHEQAETAIAYPATTAPVSEDRPQSLGHLVEINLGFVLSVGVHS